MRGDMVSTSSRNRVDPCALSKCPAWSESAPVNEPLMWPNNSDSRIESAVEAQSVTTSASCPRDDMAWMALATISLPTPVSPRTRMGYVHLAATSIIWRTSCASLELPRNPS
jgi:hypothetical protein